MTCSVEPKDRRDCGYYLITSDICGWRGCCWAPSADYPNCHHKGQLIDSSVLLIAVLPFYNPHVSSQLLTVDQNIVPSLPLEEAVATRAGLVIVSRSVGWVCGWAGAIAFGAS